MMRGSRTAILALAGSSVSMALLTAGCAAPAAPARHGAARASHHSSPVPVVTAAPAWCTPAFAAAANGKAAARLLPYVRDSPYVKDLYERWLSALAENNLILRQADKWSVQDLLDHAPVTTDGLYPDALDDIRHLNRICGGQ